MLCFTSRQCWAVLTARLHVRSFALVAGRQINAEELQRLVNEARRPRKRGRPRKQAPTCSRMGNEAFADSQVGGGGISFAPKSCRAEGGADCPKSLRIKVQRMVNTARHRFQGCELDTDFLFDLILRQEGRCAYSGVHLELLELLVPYAHWRMSLERLDNKQGYLRHNVVLIAQEFNSIEAISEKATLQGSSQWSKQKVEQLRLERNTNVDLENLRRQIGLATWTESAWGNMGGFCIEYLGAAEPGTLKCSTCGIWKPFCQYSQSWRSTKHFSSQCEQCRGECTWTKRMKTVRGAIQSMIASARARHRLGRWHGDFKLEVDDVLGMLWAQRGRCYYSHVPLRYAQSNVDWLMSLERLDNTKTYTKANTCLVALEFNTRAQWSREKVQFVWGNMLGDEETPDFPKFFSDFPSFVEFPAP